MSFPLSKRSQQEKPYVPSPNVVIKPMDPLIQQVVNDMRKVDPNYFMDVDEIVVESGGSSQLGYVKRGPSDSPRTIHIFKDRIRGIIQQNYGNQLTGAAFQKAVHDAIAEVIGHEKTHIGKEPEKAFKGEGEAERGGAEMLGKMKPADDALVQAAIELCSIREKLLPSMPMTEPNLAFVAYSCVGDRCALVREGMSLFKSGSIHPAASELCRAASLNATGLDLVSWRMAGMVPAKSHPYSSEFALKTACLQAVSGLRPTGVFDRHIAVKITDSVDFHMFPKNFGVVVPGRLYRGGLPDRFEHLQALTNECGVKRIVSLHDEPHVAFMCKILGLQHVPAYLETGAPGEPGRKTLGDSVSSFLMEVPTYVHCLHGQDRTGGVIARFRTENGWSRRQAYLEAKAYGMQDMFVDLIEWFCEKGSGELPIDTSKIRRFVCGRDPQVEEQDLIEPTPNDMPFGSPFDMSRQYVTWADTLNNIAPTSLTPPIPTGQGT